MLKEKVKILKEVIAEINKYNKVRDIGEEITFHFEEKHLPDPLIKGYIIVGETVVFKETYSYAKGKKTVDEIKEIVIDRLLKVLIYNSIVSAYSTKKQFENFQKGKELDELKANE